MKSYYDALFYDEEGAKRYLDFILEHAQGKSLIEFGCGTGDGLHVLNQHYDAVGVDLDPEMLSQVSQKYPELEGKVEIGNFCDYHGERFDTAVCIGDSTNYILTEEDLIRFADSMCRASNHLIMDCHHPKRLEEFADDYYEEGSTDRFDYAYQIQVEDDRLIHIINFLDGSFDTIEQWVFDPKLLIRLFEERGYSVQVFTDQIHPGYLEDGEKICLVAHKELV